MRKTGESHPRNDDIVVRSPGGELRFSLRSGVSGAELSLTATRPPAGPLQTLRGHALRLFEALRPGLDPGDPAAARRRFVQSLKSALEAFNARAAGISFSLEADLEDERNSLPETSYEICLTNRCNMACRYCYWGDLNPPRPEWLPLALIRRAVDLYFRYLEDPSFPARAGRRFERNSYLCLIGGEPLLNWDLLRGTLSYLRKRSNGSMPSHINTNGTLLDEDRVRFITEHGGEITVSIDGSREHNDLQRVFAGARASASVFDAIAGNLARLPSSLRSLIRARMVKTPATISTLAEDYDHLLRMGFPFLSYETNLLVQWSDGDLRALREAMARFRRYCLRNRIDTSSTRCKITWGLNNLLKTSPLRPGGEIVIPVLDNITVAPDGFFYPSSNVATYGEAKRVYRIGSLARGLDFARMRAVQDEVSSYFRRNGIDARTLESQETLYFDSRLRGVDPLPRLVNAQRVIGVIREELGCLRKEK